MKFEVSEFQFEASQILDSFERDVPGLHTVTFVAAGKILTHYLKFVLFPTEHSFSNLPTPPDNYIPLVFVVHLWQIK